MGLINKIRYGSIVFFTITLIISIVFHTRTLCIIEHGVIDRSNVISLVLLTSLVLNYKVTVYLLVIFSFVVLSFEFVPQILNNKLFERLYYDISVGSSASSYLGVNVIHKNFITTFFRNIFEGLHLLLTFYIIVVEIPFRQYKKKHFPFKNCK